MNKIMVNVLLSTVSGLILRPIHPTKNLKKNIKSIDIKWTIDIIHVNKFSYWSSMKKFICI